MSNPILINTLRFVFLVLFQVLVLKQLVIGPIGPYSMDVIVFPLFILLLPVRTTRELLLLLGFVTGILVDMFYDSWGVHASACVFLAFARPAILRQLEPKGGYNVNYGLTIQRYKMPWFLRYCALSMALYLAFYFSMQVFTPVYILEILVKTILGFIASFIFSLILMLIFNPMD